MALSVTLHRLVSRASTVAALGALAFGCASGSTATDDLPPVPDASVDTGYADTLGGDTGISTDGGADASEVAADTGPASCKTNADCAKDPAGKFCLTAGDGGKSYCVPCLPAPFDECGAGTYCSDVTYTCESGCKTTADCLPGGGGDAGVDGGAEAGGDPDAASEGGTTDGGGKPLVCDSVKHRCVGCVADPDCPAGFLCDRPAGTCIPGCSPTHACPTDKDCCSGSCIDPKTDVKNCGGCGTTCPTPPNATAACIAGACGIGTCTTGYGDCNASAADGCETNTQTNKDNCGGCGTKCALANATAACTAGSCTVATCNGGYDDCDKIASTGCEVDLKSDSNCGSCGKLCTIPNGTGSCATGTCLLTACNPGYGDCNGLPADGCETNTAGGVAGPSGTILNCGTCGTSCSVANGTPACVSGACKVQSCTAPYADCNGTFADGCESNTSIDKGNCGGCGNVCNSTNGVASCAASKCGIACSSGWGDCDKDATNGCEINLTSDKNNCAACGSVCATSGSVLATACVASSCSATTCAAGTYDRNKLFADGCECTEDSYGNNCGAAFDVGTIVLDVSPKKTVTGNLVGTGDSDEDWFKITFAVGPSCAYTPSVSLSGGPDVKMQVYTACGGATASGSFSCSGSGEPANSNASLDAWEFRQGSSCGDFDAIDPTPDTGSFLLTTSVIYVRVFRATSATTCYPYTLTIGN